MTTDYMERRVPVPPSPAGSALTVLLTAIFAIVCVLKLAGAVAAPWAMILAPIWLPLACLYVFVAAALLLAVRK